MSGLPQKKCPYYNTGYCKFARKESGCKNYHPKNVCKVTKCRDKTCPDRHPKVCRFKEECRFQLCCSYNHSTPEQNQNACEEITSLTEAVNIVKKEIDTLKDKNHIQNNNIVKVQLAELDKIRNENVKLTQSSQLTKESFDIYLRRISLLKENQNIKMNPRSEEY